MSKNKRTPNDEKSIVKNTNNPAFEKDRKNTEKQKTTLPPRKKD
jgi:hypothetical protein